MKNNTNNTNNSTKKKNSIKLLTSSVIDQEKYESIGIVMGVSVRAISALRQLFSGLASIVGGRRGEIEKKLIEAREEAIQEMRNNAVTMGANEVIGVHVEMSEISQGDRDGYIVVSATGTAVKTKI